MVSRDNQSKQRIKHIMDGDNVIDAEREFETIALRNEIEKLKNEVIKYKILLNEIDSDANPDIVSDEEAICVEQIHKLKENSGKRQLSTDEVKKLDILHKNLKLARGQGTRVGARNQAGALSAKDLADIAKGR